MRTACRPDGLRAWAAAGWRAMHGAMHSAMHGAMHSAMHGACSPHYLDVDDALEGPRPVRQAGEHPAREPPHRALGSTGHRRRRGDEAARGEGEGEGGEQRGQRGAPLHVVARGARAAEGVDVLRGGGEKGWASTQGCGAWLAGEGRGAAPRLQGDCWVARLPLRALRAVDAREAAPLAARRHAAAAARALASVRVGAPGSAGWGGVGCSQKRAGCVGLAGSWR